MVISPLATTYIALMSISVTCEDNFKDGYEHEVESDFPGFFRGFNYFFFTLLLMVISPLAKI